MTGDYRSISDRVVEAGPKPMSDAKAQEELKGLDLDHTKKRKGVQHKLLMLSIRILWAVALAVLFIRVWHFIGPKCWYWLDSEQISSLDKLLFSGAVGSALGKYGGKMLEE